MLQMKWLNVLVLINCLACSHIPAPPQGQVYNHFMNPVHHLDVWVCSDLETHTKCDAVTSEQTKSFTAFDPGTMKNLLDYISALKRALQSAEPMSANSDFITLKKTDALNVLTQIQKRLRKR